MEYQKCMSCIYEITPAKTGEKEGLIKEIFDVVTIAEGTGLGYYQENPTGNLVIIHVLSGHRLYNSQIKEEACIRQILEMIAPMAPWQSSFDILKTEKNMKEVQLQIAAVFEEKQKD